MKNNIAYTLFFLVVCSVSGNSQKNIWDYEHLYSNRVFPDSIQLTTNHLFLAQTDTLIITNNRTSTNLGGGYNYWTWDKHKIGFSLTYHYSDSNERRVGVNFFVRMNIKKMNIMGEKCIVIKYFDPFASDRKTYTLFIFRYINKVEDKYNSLYYYKKV